MFRPVSLFNETYSLVLLDRNGKLLGASLAADEQWRFPPTSALPEKFEAALICFEDKRFYQHLGVDPLAVLRALRLNLRENRIASGASTITMQVIRLSRHRGSRHIVEKMIEMVLALQLEFRYSKQEILTTYAAHAPFGGNVVGLEAASWRYFGREPSRLSWAESAMLAVLPNSPALMHPGRNRDLLLNKRNKLLARLWRAGKLDSLSFVLACNEPLPGAPHSIPMEAPHLFDRIKASRQAAGHDRYSFRVNCTLDKDLQKLASEIVERHSRMLALNNIHNAAALILDVESGEALAYIGNVFYESETSHGNQVDVITAPRSTGSILKPFLFAALQQSGECLPNQLVADIPTRMGGFSPENYNRTYLGVVPAAVALAKSLNVPAVRMLHAYGVDRFYSFLRGLGMTTLNRSAADYGLSLILGGAEGTLWEITGIYASMARTLNDFFHEDHSAGSPFHSPVYLKDVYQKTAQSDPPLEAESCWITLSSLMDVKRPEEENAWNNFLSTRPIAWKTGTSYGLRDGWAVGVTPRLAVGVWVGNASGEGQPGLTGVNTAGPILFDLFSRLKTDEWFQRPEQALQRIAVCARSGYRQGPFCAESREEWVTETSLSGLPCPYCRRIHCDATLTWQVTSNCEEVSRMRAVNWFILPPAMEYFYVKRHAEYHPLPPFRPDCLAAAAGEGNSSLTIVYPDNNGRIYIPLEIDGQRGRTVFEAAHRDPQVSVFWHLDDAYLGSTHQLHQMTLAPPPGDHVLTLVDENGEMAVRRFQILTR